MAIKVKKGGAYAASVAVYAKKNGVYSAITGLSAKVAGAYVSASSAPAMRAVAGRLLAPPQQISAGNTFFKAKTWHKLFVAVNGTIEIWWPNFYTATGGGAPGGGCSDQATNAATAVASITYTDPGTGVQTVNLLDKAGGTTALSATAGGWFKAVATINAAAGSIIFPKIYGNLPGGCFFSLGKADAANGDLFQFQSTAMSLAGDPVSTFPSFRSWYGPSLIAALSTTPVLAIIGDSRDDGLRDLVNDATGNIGVFMRTFGGFIPVVNLSGRGDLAQSFVNATASARRRDLLPYSTFKGLGEGINDLAANRTSAQLLADQATIAALDANPSIYRTQNPFTTGGITTPWSATPESYRQAYNTAVRAMSLYFDPDGVLSTGGSGGWTNEDSVSIDYLHETNLGNAYAATNGALVGTSAGVHGVAARGAGAVYPGWGTNLFTFNRDPSNAAWTKNDTTVVTAQPDAEAGSSAMKVQETATTNKHSLAKGPISVSPGTFETWFDIAPGGRDWMFIQIIDQTFAFQALQWFNVTTGALGNTFNTDTSILNCTAKSIAAIPGTVGYYRCKMTFDVGPAATGIYVSAKVDTGNGADATYLGDITKGIVIRPLTWLRQTFVAPVADTFNPASTNANVTLSEANIRATNASAGDFNTRSVLSRSSGKQYFEIQRVSGQQGIGVCTSALPTNTWVGSSALSTGMDPSSDTVFTSGANQGSSGLGTINAGDIIGVAVDFTAGKMWFSKNGGFGSGQDPVAGTGGYTIPAGALFICFAPKTLAANGRLRTLASQFLTAPPTGFSAWVP